jgi:sugar lactone lactonase YvrE
MGSSCQAQGTKLWTVTRYDEMERGTSSGVAIRSDGALEPGPAVSSVYQSGGNLIWSVAAGPAGTAYLGLGGTAAGSAVVMHVGADGKPTKALEAHELGVQALRAGAGGAVYAATSPDGKVYRLGATPADAAVVFDSTQTTEKPKYIWDVAQSGSDLYVATGAPAVVYRVSAGGKPQVAFRTADQHIRCLLIAPDGTLWAGTDGSGVIYRFDTKAPGAKPFAVYAAARREITSLAMDATGNIYAAGVGQRPAPGAGMSLPPLPVTGIPGVSVTFNQPGSANAANSNTLLPEGSEIYRIAPDGTPSRLVTLKDDVVYALAFHNGSLLAGTGNRGRIYRIDTAAPGRLSDLAHLESAQAMALAEAGTSVFVATSNSGRLYRLDDKPAADASYTSEVFDARVFSKWGRVEVSPDNTSGAELYLRSGNVENPLMGWSDWVPVKQGQTALPGGRFAQWKAVLHSGSAVNSVALNYLQKNLAPVVDDVVAQPGARVQPTTPSTSTTVQVNFPAAASSQNTMSFGDSSQPPLIAQKDKSAVTIRWTAHDDNGDDLMYSVWYRGVGEKNWRLLTDKISDKFYSFDSSQLPDGNYEVRVVASDAPDHVDADTLTGERTSAEFLLDTTPPVPGALIAAMVAGSPAKIHATFSAKDATSPIAHAEYSVDAGPWQYLEPIGKVSDSLEERYDFTADLPATNAGAADPREHVIAVRVFDRFENVASAKAVVH